MSAQICDKCGEIESEPHNDDRVRGIMLDFYNFGEMLSYSLGEEIKKAVLRERERNAERLEMFADYAEEHWPTGRWRAKGVGSVLRSQAASIRKGGAR